VRTPPGRAGTSTAAGVLILALTALFGVIGIDHARDALDPDRVDRETLLAAIGLGLNPDETRNLLAITAIVLLALSALTTVIGIGVLGRREGVRHAAIGTFVVFAVVTIPLAVSGLLQDDPSPGVLIGLAVGIADALVVYLLLRPETAIDFERAEDERLRWRSERRASRRAERSRTS
jgi:hypothetical protein